MCRVFHKSKRDEITPETTHMDPGFDMAAPASAPSSLCSPWSYVQFPPAAEANMVPWNNINNNVEEVAGGFRSNGVDHDYSTIQRMKFEIEDSIQNDFIPFEYFIA